MTDTTLNRLYGEQGQAPWQDNISRGMITSGALRHVIDLGIVGVTSNPTIFEKALGSGTDYDEQIRQVYADCGDPSQVFFELMLKDIGDAADVFREVYDRTNHLDGYISIEVTPDLARETQKTVEQAHMFHDRLKRPNVLVKIPATEEGIPAIEQAIYEGISVNVTLIFSLDRYRQVIEAYMKGIERREAEGQPVDDIFSVASFFVSRFDTKVDKMIDELIAKATNPADQEKLRSLKGKGAIANAKIAYQLFQQEFGGARWQKLAAKGANVQRPLWASTSTKNPDYPDTLYADALIGPDTVDTMPNPTIEAFLDHGTVARTVDQDVDAAHQVIADLVACGISMEQVMQELEDEGVASFAKSYETLGKALQEKCAAVHQGQEQNAETELGPFQGAVHETLTRLEDAGQRIWNKDGSWWSSDREVQQKIVDRLGWLNVIKQMIGEADDLRDFANEICKAGFERVLVMGMGGSSLAPDLFSVEFETADGFPELYVLDSTDPAVVALCRDGLPAKDTLYVVSSKSGTTIEPNAFFAYFWEQVKKIKGDQAGEHFIAITDPGTPLVDLAKHYGFRRVFENPPDIGGRYSVLSYFGLVPAALMGLDVRKLLDRAYNMVVRCGPGVPAPENPGVWLGAALGAFAAQGRDKVTFVTTPGLDGFGDWAEQLIAESTGKEGQGLVPVAREEVGPPEVYGDDRLFVYLRLATDETDDYDEAVDALIDAGQPVITLPLDDEYDLGAEFFRWEIAIAVAGQVLGINPFDEPNVTESKKNTSRLLDEYTRTGRLPEDDPSADEGEIEMFVYATGGATGDGSPNGTGRAAVTHNRNGASAESGPLVENLQTLFDSVQPHDYFAILAYLEPSEEDIEQLEAMRIMIRDVLKVATTIGFGPRFLHSTGQLHKGGPNTGVFLVFTSDEASDIKIPGQGYSFGTLIRAQALGDIEALVAKGRRVIRLHLMNVEEGLEQAADLVDAALPAETAVE
jgi:transaldolase/glucose-6-phosphate isomerase